MHGFTILMSCTQDVRIRGFALQTERGRHVKRPWDFNYSIYFLYNIIHFIVLKERIYTYTHRHLRAQN